MKANIHPDYHEITVVMTDGTKYQMRTTYGKAGDVMNLDVDPLTHPAWNGGTSGQVIEKAQLSKFENRYGGFLTAGAGAAKAPAAAEAPATEAKKAPKAEAKKEEKKKK